MTIFSLYIFDRHCSCVYYHDWNRTQPPKAATKDGILPAVSRSVTSQSKNLENASTTFNSPRNTLSSTVSFVAAVNDESQSVSTSRPIWPVAKAPTSLPFEEEAKLVYGVILSLRNIVRKLSKRDELFTSYRTTTYKLHLYETASGYKFVLLTDPRAESVRFVLRQLYSGPFIDYVVRNPLVDMNSRERGIDNELFRASTDRFVRGLSFF